jgi:DNA invertase Pin-like site-specific DNA recombinase
MCEMQGHFMKKIGYARVSTDGQSLDDQIFTLRAAGCEVITSEKVTGVQTDRVELRKMLEKLQPGDEVVVTRLDRLARSTRDLLNIIAEVSDAGATFVSLGDVWANTASAHGRLLLTVLGGLAEFERELIRSRTSEGKARAIKRGVRFGRRPKLTQHQRIEARERKTKGDLVVDIARSLNVSHSTISRL